MTAERRTRRPNWVARLRRAGLRSVCLIILLTKTGAGSEAAYAVHHSPDCGLEPSNKSDATDFINPALMLDEACMWRAALVKPVITAVTAGLADRIVVIRDRHILA